MKTATVADAIERVSKDEAGNNLHVSIELRCGRLISGYVKTVWMMGDAVEIKWFVSGTDIVSSDEVALIHGRET